MRILHVAESFAAGVFEVVRTLSGYQREAGHQVTIAYARRADTPADLREAIGPGITLVELPWRHRNPPSTARATAALRRMAAADPPDVAHLHSAFAGFAGSIVLPGLCPTVYTPHGYSVLREGLGPISRRLELAGERWIARRVDEVGAVSNHEAELAQTVIRARHVTVIPNGIPELDNGSAPSNGSRGRSRPLVVTMGRISPQRRPAQAAAVLEGVKDLADVEWIGDRIGEDSATEVPDVPVTGWLDRDEALARLGDATAYVNWSAWDGSPLAVMEALARDVIVVASDIPANRELLGPEQLRGDTEGAISLLRRILTDDTARERFLDDQRSTRSRYSGARMAADWQRLYSELIESRGTET